MHCLTSSLLCLWSVATLLNAVPLPEDGETVHVELVRALNNHRLKRDVEASLMPDSLVMSFPLGKDDVILRLHRVRNPPMYLVGEQGVTKVTGLENDMSSVYVDPSRSASFVISQARNGHYVLDGNLKHDKQQLLMTPAARRKRSSDNNSSSSNSNDNMHDVTVVPPQVEIHEFDHGAAGEKAARGARANGKPVVRAKRQSSIDQHVIETIFVIDHTDYEAWSARYPTNTLTQLRNYYTYIGQTLNNIYASVKEVDSSVDIKVAITGLFVVTSSANAVSVSASGVVEGGDFLDDFEKWIETTLPSNLKPSDHYMAFTAYDVLFNSGGAVGVAKSGVVCTDSSVSVVENSFRASVANVAAHELGHSLSADHDGDDDAAACSPYKQNVMTPTFTAPPIYSTATDADLFTFSSCSVAAFKSYLDSQSCSEPAETSADLELPFQGYNNEFITDRTKQCQFAVNSDSEFCDPSRFSNFEEGDICVGMLCRVPSNVENVLNCTYVLPFEGTSCGTGKICFQGLCVDESTVTQASQTFTDPPTQAPTTQAPTTQAPTTQAPTTQAPTTQAPTTQAPTTQAPTTQAPTTQAPTTQAPTTQAPTTQAPTTQTPTTQAPTTQAPTTQAPTTQAPTTQAPTTQAPTTQAPTTQAPTTQAPTTQAPTTQAPTTVNPTDQANENTGTTDGNNATTTATTPSTSSTTTAAPCPCRWGSRSYWCYRRCLRNLLFSYRRRVPMNQCCRDRFSSINSFWLFICGDFC